MICNICKQPMKGGDMATRYSIDTPTGKEIHLVHNHCLTLFKERNIERFKQ